MKNPVYRFFADPSSQILENFRDKETKGVQGENAAATAVIAPDVLPPQEPSACATNELSWKFTKTTPSNMPKMCYSSWRPTSLQCSSPSRPLRLSKTQSESRKKRTQSAPGGVGVMT